MDPVSQRTAHTLSLLLTFCLWGLGGSLWLFLSGSYVWGLATFGALVLGSCVVAA